MKFLPVRGPLRRITDWRTVAVGFVVIVVVGTGGLALPVIGQIGAGLLDGFAADYLAGGTLDNGAWNNLVADSISGIVVTLFTALLRSLLGLADGPLDGLLGDVGVLIADAVLTFISAIDSAIAEAAGAWVKGRG